MIWTKKNQINDLKAHIVTLMLLYVCVCVRDHLHAVVAYELTVNAAT